jgi:hypothetical protein
VSGRAFKGDPAGKGFRTSMSQITVLAIHDRIGTFHSLKAFLFAKDQGRFVFTDSPEWCLSTDRNEILVMVRWFIKPDLVDLELMKRLRAKYRRIAFFHDDAGGGIPRLEVLPHVDLFYSKALFRDRSLYRRQLYGKELYSDYYHTKYGITDPDARERAVVEDPAELSKLRLSWNIGVGDYPRGKLRQRAGVAVSMALGFKAARLFYGSGRLPRDPVASNRGTIAVHARILLAGRPSIAQQRKLILDKIESRSEFLKGETSQAAYNHEVASSRIVLSPFGWGELCLRDYEAVLGGALLLKPDMGHLETWPDVFQPNETYAPFDWDASDLLEVTARYLDDEAARRRIAARAFETYRDQLSHLDERFESAMAEIEG